MDGTDKITEEMTIEDKADTGKKWDAMKMNVLKTVEVAFGKINQKM